MSFDFRALRSIFVSAFFAARPRSSIMDTLHLQQEGSSRFFIRRSPQRTKVLSGDKQSAHYIINSRLTMLCKYDNLQLEIVGLNKHTYETRYKVLDMNVLERENLTKYEVHLKIDNLNVEDMFDRNRTEKLLDIFRSVTLSDIIQFSMFQCPW